METAIRKLETNVFSKLEYLLELGGIKKIYVFGIIRLSCISQLV